MGIPPHVQKWNQALGSDTAVPALSPTTTDRDPLALYFLKPNFTVYICIPHATFELFWRIYSQYVADQIYLRSDSSC